MLVLEPAVASAAQTSYLTLPVADRADVEKFLGDPSLAVRRTYKRRGFS